MRIIHLASVLLLVALIAPPSASAAERSSLRAILIVASNQEGGPDPRLAPYEPTLRRILRFESFRFIGEGTTALAIPGRAALPLAQGHRLEVESEASSGRRIRVSVRWLHRGKALMDQPLALNRATPAVLGGPATDKAGAVYAVILIANVSDAATEKD